MTDINSNLKKYNNVIETYLKINPDFDKTTLENNKSLDFITYLIEEIVEQKYLKIALYWMSEDNDTNYPLVAKPTCFLYEQFLVDKDEVSDENPLRINDLLEEFKEWIIVKYDISIDDTNGCISCYYGGNIFSRNMDESALLLNKMYEFLSEHKNYNIRLIDNDYSITLWYPSTPPSFNADMLFQKSEKDENDF